MRPVASLTALVVAATLAAGCGAGNDRIVVAAGTTLVDSGLLDVMAAEYESIHRGVEVSVVGLSTREVLELGDRGAADLLITHAPDQEREYLATHPQATSAALFSSRFLLAGPPERADLLNDLTIDEALRRIAAAGWEFVTRADASGTYERETSLWAAAGVEPGGSWYTETGQGMGLTLQVADQRRAFILVEEGTFLSAADVLQLEATALAADGGLDNPYTAIVPAPDRLAGAFVDRMLSADGRGELQRANLDAFGREVFGP